MIRALVPYIVSNSFYTFNYFDNVYDFRTDGNEGSKQKYLELNKGKHLPPNNHSKREGWGLEILFLATVCENVTKP